MSTDAKRYISDLQSLEENPRGFIPKSYIFHPTCKEECPFDCDQDNWQLWENPKDKAGKAKNFNHKLKMVQGTSYHKINVITLTNTIKLKRLQGLLF